MRVACIVQGNVRIGTEIILEEMSKKFDYVVFSTWQDEKFNFKAENLIVIYNDKPSNYGLSNRNLLRYSTSSALKVCENLSCDFILKIRSDMLFLKISKEMLFDLLGQWKFSKILTFNFRCLTSCPDCYSSINDLFSFGSLTLTKLLWSDEGFDFSKSYNVPPDKNILSLENDDDFLELWQPETELYSFFKHRLRSNHTNFDTHIDIIREYFVFVEFRKFKILWFSQLSFRSIFQAYHHPWWSMKDYYGKKAPKVVRLNRSLNKLELVKYKLSFLIVNYNIFIQWIYYVDCLLKKKFINVFRSH